MTTRKNYKLVDGQALAIPLVYASATGTTGAYVPINLSNYTASAVFESPEGAVLINLAEVGATGPGIYKDAAAGYLRLGLNEDQVHSLRPKSYYKLFIENQFDSTDRIALLHGAITFDV